MACNIFYLEYLADKGALQDGFQLLDIGTQNLYNATADQVSAFVQRFPRSKVDLSLAADLAQRSIVPPPIPDIPTTFVSEMIDLTTIDYHSFDVAPGLKTRIFDLNRESLPASDARAYDLVLNFGTTEHVFNQVNCFQVIHGATKVGGYMFHQVPGTGGLRHGYFVYNRRFFVELAQANDYELIDLWYTGPHVGQKFYESHPDLEAMDKGRYKVEIEEWKKYPILNSIINVLFRKKNDDHFRLPLEVSTTHYEVDRRIQDEYKRRA